MPHTSIIPLDLSIPSVKDKTVHVESSHGDTFGGLITISIGEHYGVKRNHFTGNSNLESGMVCGGRSLARCCLINR